MTTQSTIRGPQFGTSGVVDLRFERETIERLEALEKRVKELIEPKLRFQIGVNNIPFGPGFQFTEIALTKPWTKRHLLFLASLKPQLENGCWLTNWGPYNEKSEESLTHAFIEINNPKAQNIVVYWISVGE